LIYALKKIFKFNVNTFKIISEILLYPASLK